MIFMAIVIYFAGTLFPKIAKENTCSAQVTTTGRIYTYSDS